MSMFSYGGVTLPYCMATKFSQDAVYEDSDTDRIYTKFDISVQAVLNTDYLAVVAPALVGLTTNSADIMNWIRNTLLKPKQTLAYTVGGVNLIPAVQPGNAGTVDAKNGPHPQTCLINALTKNTFLITYHIIAHYWETISNTPNESPVTTAQVGANVLYNRWSESVDISNLNYSTRTRAGKFIIRSDNVAGWTADQARVQMATVAVPAGFKRKSSKYTISKDGLGLEYVVIDEEVFKQPPQPAYEATGKYTETVHKGAKRICTVTLTLKGSKTTPQQDLIKKAVDVAIAKVTGSAIDPLANASFGTLTLPLEFTVEVPMYSNEVTVISKWLAQPRANTRNDNVTAARYYQMQIAPGSEAGTPAPLYPIGGTANIPLQAAAYYDPSIPGVMVNPTTNQLSTGLQPGQAGKKKS